MARRGIGIFGVLLAVGSLLALRCAQKQNRAVSTLARDVARWEGEGGAVASSTTGAARAAYGANGANGAHPPGVDGDGDAWRFPRG